MDIFPAVLKPNSEGSSLGVEKVEKPEDLEQARRKVLEFGEKMILEKFVSGRVYLRSFTVRTLESPVPLPIVEVIAPDGNYNFHNKYEGDKLNIFAPQNCR